MNGLENWWSPGQCSCTQVCGCNGYCAWLWLWTGWSPSIFSWLGTIYFLFPNIKKKFGWEAVSDRWWGHRHICGWRLFRGSGWELLYHRNPSTATSMKEVCGLQGRLQCMLKNKPHLVKFDHCITVSLWTFQPTLIHGVGFLGEGFLAVGIFLAHTSLELHWQCTADWSYEWWTSNIWPQEVNYRLATDKDLWQGLSGAHECCPDHFLDQPHLFQWRLQ